MFGYVRPVLEKLSPEEQDRFQSVYCGLCHALGGVGAQPVVAVGELEVFARGGGDGPVAAVGHAGVPLFFDQAEAAVLFAPGPAAGGAAVGAAVVHQQHLDLPPRLGADAGKAAVQGLFSVVDRHDDAHQGAFFHVLRSFLPIRLYISGANRHKKASTSFFQTPRRCHSS